MNVHEISGPQPTLAQFTFHQDLNKLKKSKYATDQTFENFLKAFQDLVVEINPDHEKINT